MKNDLQTPKQQALLLQEELTKVRHLLLSTKSFFTENAQELQRLAEEEGANIAILTDYDVSGAVIAKEVPEVTRIGIDENTLKQLGIEDRQSMLEDSVFRQSMLES